MKQLEELEVDLGDLCRIRLSRGAATLEARSALSPAIERELREGALCALDHWAREGTVLHATCVSIGSVAVAFMGPSGTGKSTLAAALVNPGTELVSDGMTLVQPRGRRVVRGPNRCKLSDESIERLGREAGERVGELSPKKYVWLDERGADIGAELEVAYVVADADHEAIEELSPVEQVRALVANTYMLSHLAEAHRGRILIDAAALVNAGVHVKRLNRRKAWQHLDGLLELVRRDVAATLSDG